MKLHWVAIPFALWLAALGQANAQLPSPDRTLALWPAERLADGPALGPERVGKGGSAEGAVSGVSQPRLEIYKPAHPNGSAVLVIGGGGYFRIQVGGAARPIAQWLQAIGTTAAVLYYRLPGDGWTAQAPFQDGQRAMRLLRAHAAELGVDPQRIGVIGLSAGANLAGIVATRPDFAFYPPLDASDAQPARPDFVGMIYPVVSLRPPLNTTRSARELSTQADAADAYSVEAHVDAKTPPTFLAQAVDDPIVAVDHSLLMFTTLRKAGVPAELHVFERGRHSWGLGAPGSTVSAWPRLFAAWARSHGFLGGAPAAAAPAAEDGGG
ncbi:alpha/beta hydrolase [Luteimonas aquatica]|uniref:alpha/beta hydrolase n=1 Tax=Luteimonas aquatica TaxID=450364 RepID=UPI001F5A9D00|nr:alpha/beta hydrolase [Luteimonas aquatica]